VRARVKKTCGIEATVGKQATSEFPVIGHSAGAVQARTEFEVSPIPLQMRFFFWGIRPPGNEGEEGAFGNDGRSKSAVTQQMRITILFGGTNKERWYR